MWDRATMKDVISRRALLEAAVAAGFGAVLLSAAARAQLYQSSCDDIRPKPEALRNADLLWTKLPGTPIPYAAGQPPADITTSRAAFEAGRARMLEELRSREKLGDEEWRFKEWLTTLDYESFYGAYFAAADPTRPVPYDSAAWLVGHVALVEVTAAGERFVIEAVRPKVHRIPYQKWEESRPGQAFWHGRLARGKAAGFTAAKYALIVAKAVQYVGKPYDLFAANALHLADVSAFYCSKLVWLSVMQATNLAMDDNPAASRWFWLSPKQLLASPHVAKLSDPGHYGRC